MTIPSNSDLQKTSDSAAFIALIFMIFFFLGIVGFGWLKIISPMVNSIPVPFEGLAAKGTIAFYNLAAFAAAAFCAIFAVVLAKYVASERVNLLANDESSTSPRVLPWIAKVWPFLLILLFLSALGTARTIFSVTQEKDVLRDAVTETAEHLRNLDRTIIARLNELPEYTEQKKIEATFKATQRRAQLSLDQFSEEMMRVKRTGERELEDQHTMVENLWRNFENEVRNPANCGFGPVAQRHFRELRSALPDLTQTSTTAGCDKQKDQKVLKSYRLQVDALKQSTFKLEKLNCNFSPAAINHWQDLTSFLDQVPSLPTQDYNCADISGAVEKLTAAASKNISLMTPSISVTSTALIQYQKNAQDQIKAQTSVLEDVNKANSIPTNAVLSELRPSWELYRKLLAEGESVTSINFGLNREIKRDEVENIQSMMNILRILAKRWNKLMTYFTLLFAILLDLILIAFFYRHLSIGTRKASTSPYDDYVLQNDSPFDIK